MRTSSRRQSQPSFPCGGGSPPTPKLRPASVGRLPLPVSEADCCTPFRYRRGLDPHEPSHVNTICCQIFFLTTEAEERSIAGEQYAINSNLLVFPTSSDRRR